MEIRQLRSFVAVADLGSFTAAAERLHIVQSAVSQHVRQLERQLGLPLLTRTGGVRPTAAGRLVLERARRVLAETEAIDVDMADLRGLVVGAVRVGSLTWFGPYDLPGLLATYVRAHPGVEVTLREDSTPRMMADVLADELDLSFVSLPSTDVPAGLVLLPLAREEMVLVAGGDLVLSKGKSARLVVLDDLPFVAFARGLGLRETVDIALRAAGARPRIVMESNLPGMVRSLVASGAGAAMVPRSVAEAAGPGVLRTWTIAPKPVRRVLGIVWSAQHPLPPAAAALLGMARAQR